MPPLNDRCRVPEVLLTDSAPLPFTSAAIRRHRSLVIVALGSSSTFGYGASTSATTYPAVLQRELSAALGYSVRVINRGVNGETIGRTTDRIPKDVLAIHPVLVIWQSGTNDLLHTSQGSVNTFRHVLADGVHRIRKAGIDVILMDLQYFPSGERRPGMNAYLDAIQQVGESYKVPVIHRHKIMSYWVASGEMTLDGMLYRDNLHMSDRAYRCLGETVSAFILHQAADAPHQNFAP
jgi:acyl-CoA thioesterase I